MSEQVSNADSGWEQQRRTGRFAVEPYTIDETNEWLESIGLPPTEQHETYFAYNMRVKQLVQETDLSDNISKET